MKINYKIDYISEEYIFLLGKLHQLNLYSSDAVIIAQDIYNKIGEETFGSKLMDLYGISAICEALQQIVDKEKAKLFLDEMYRLYPPLFKKTIAVYIILTIEALGKHHVDAIIQSYKTQYGETELLLRTELNYLFENGYEQNSQRIETILSKLQSFN